MNSSLLKEKKAVVVGGSGEIGEAIADILFENSAEVAIFDLKASNSKYIHDSHYRSFRLDLRDSSSIRMRFMELTEIWGKVDILVHAAGVNLHKKFTEVNETSWDTTMDINLKSVFFCAQSVYPLMPGGGKIILISSISSRLGYYGRTEYCTSKGGLDALTRNLAIELAEDKIQVNAIAPGTTRTQMTAGLWNDPKRNMAHTATIPAGRIAEVRDHANLALFLASGLSDYITGAVIPSDGGQSIIQAGFLDLGLSSNQ